MAWGLITHTMSIKIKSYKYDQEHIIYSQSFLRRLVVFQVVMFLFDWCLHEFLIRFIILRRIKSPH